MSSKRLQLLLTCEHGGNDLPAEWRRLARRAPALLRSHRGFDAGALPLARAMGKALGAPLIDSTTTRLLVDLNRSPHNPAVFSTLTRPLDAPTRRQLIERYHRPHWQLVIEQVLAMLAAGPVLHVGVHSFVPVLDGEVRTAEVGLLYDPARREEKATCHRWRDALAEAASDWRVRMNYPYRGVSDGLVTALRKRFDGRAYQGVELEINQSLLSAGGRLSAKDTRRLAASLRRALVY